MHINQSQYFNSENIQQINRHIENILFKMPIDLYFVHLSPPSRTAYMVSKELGIDINIKLVNIMKGEHLTAEYLKINPQHTVPTINDNGFILWESHAISTYLFEKYSNGKKDFLYPKDIKKRAHVDRLLHFDSGVLFPPVREYVPPKFGATTDDPSIGEKKLYAAFEFLEAFLEQGPYLTGDKYTLADISILSTIAALEVFEFDFTKYPKLKAWLDIMKKLPYFTECNGTALEIAGKIQRKELQDLAI